MGSRYIIVHSRFRASIILFILDITLIQLALATYFYAANKFVMIH